MLRTNLSTRPFYNERRVHLLAALVAIVVVAFTAWNAARLVTLSSRRTELRTQIARDAQMASDYRRRAETMEKSVDTDALTAVAASAREANAIIDRRTFSWTTFFNRLEDTLPAGVMLTSVTPQFDRGNILMTIGVVGRRPEDIDDFIERLEASGTFRSAITNQQTTSDDGTLAATIGAQYLPQPQKTGGAGR